MVGEEASLVAAHAEVIDEEGARGGGIGMGIERSAERREDCGGVGIEIADLLDDGADDLGLVRREVVQGTSAFRLIDLRRSMS